METGAVVVSVVAGLFGVVSSILGFIAEATKLKPDDIALSRRRSECVYPANPAFALGLSAFVLLVVAQIIVSAAAGCCGCCRPRAGGAESKRVIGIICSVLSWIAAVIAGAFYLQGAAWNAPVTRDIAEGCYFLKGGVFTRAAVLSLVAAALGIKSYIVLTRAVPAGPPAAAAGAAEPKPDGSQYPPLAGGVAVGMPQWPAQGQGQHGQAAYPHPGHGYGQAANQQFASQV